VSLFAVLALVGVACGDDDDSGSGDGSTDSTEAETDTGDFDPNEDIAEVVANDPLSGAEPTGLTRGVTDDTITIGCIYEALQFTGAEDGFRARFERANRDGELGDRQIEMLECQDDGSNADTNSSIARGLVEQDEVFGIVSISAYMDPGTTDYLGDNEVPFLGWGFKPGFCGTRWGFGFNGCLVGDSLPDAVPHAVVQGNLADAAIEASGLDPSEIQVAFQAGDSDEGRAGNAQYQTVFEDRGAEVVYNEANIPPPGSAADYTPFVQEVLAANPNLVLTATPFQDVGPFSGGLSAAGYEGANVNFVTYSPGIFESLPDLAQALEGVYVNTQTVPQEDGGDYIAQVEEDLLASGAETGDFITFAGGIAYAEADMLVQMLAAAGDDLNTTTFDAAVNGGDFVYTPIEGGPGEVAFPAGHFLPSDCSAVVQVVDAAYEVVVPFTCYESLRVR
jgi:ABC-type branched-subunit amino acid transport system substrate-binding protein